MIDIDKLENLYNGIIDEFTLTIKQLNEYGFNSTEINKLIDDNIIEKINEDYYSIKDINKLFEYGNKLSMENKYDTANRIFKKCYELDSDNYDYCFQLFIVYIHEKKYSKAFELYDKLYSLGSDNDRIDLDYYMYLLNHITNIPEKYRKKAKSIDYYDIKIDSNNKNYSDVLSYNRVRSTAVKGKFSSSCKILYSITIKNRGYTLRDIIEKNLLTQTITEERKSRKHVHNLVIKKEYDEVLNYLKNKKYKQKLNTVEAYIIKLSKSYLAIKNTGSIPKRKNHRSDSIFEAINANKFDLALKLNNQYNKGKKLLNEDNTLNIILNDICNLIDSLKETNSNDKLNSNNSFNLFVSNLLNNNIDIALQQLKIYLSSIDKSEYEYIITNLIKLSIIEKDSAYTYPMLEMSLLNNNNYEIDIENYVQKFYLSISENKLEQAKIYLDIINSANKIKNGSLAVDNLYKVLENYLAHSNPHNNTFDYYEDDTEIMMNKSDLNFIKRKHDELVKNKGIIILKPMNKERTEFILHEADKYLDISVFTIIDEGREKIVFKYNDLDYEDFDDKALISEALDDYRNKHYEESLKKQIKILETNVEQKTSNYAMIGLSYMKLQKIDEAIKYLTIANYLCKKKQKNRDYGDLLLFLKGQIDEDDIKPKIVMKQNDFRNDNIKFYGIKNFDELNTYICESGLDVETACRNINMSEEDINVVKLIYAREYYTLGNKEKGELFLKSYEKSKNKTNKTKSIYKYIQQNKKFYKARFEGEPRQLSLTLVPKK